LKPGDLVVAMLPSAVETKVRAAVIIASETYLVERPDVIVGILMTEIPSPLASTHYLLRDWQAAGLRAKQRGLDSRVLRAFAG
jgi:hypothetical protein